MDSEGKFIIIGGGLAGCEAAWQLAQRGFRVDLIEMRYTGGEAPGGKTTPAHRTGLLAELVCSNSLKSLETTNAHGLLKAELEALGSLIMEAAKSCAVPAGKALAVDRLAFARKITQRLEAHGRVHIIPREMSQLPLGPTILATGPLTSEAMVGALKKLFGEGALYFYDAIAPIVLAESLDREKIFRASRYLDEGDYLNIPLERDQYYRFVNELLSARRHQPHPFEKEVYFEGCLPIEVMAERDVDSLRFGPLKPVGLKDPKTGKRPYAVVQLRQEDRDGRMYNLVGFQTRLAQGEQRRILRMLPGMENAEFMRYGSMHRNTYLDSPGKIAPTLQVRAREDLLVAGQLCGVEGYVEAAATGLVAGLNGVRLMEGREALVPPQETIAGSLCRYVSQGSAQGRFQPMNANFGLLPPLAQRAATRRERNRALAQRSLSAIEKWRESLSL